jgi:hypothetical protein
VEIMKIYGKYEIRIERAEADGSQCMACCDTIYWNPGCVAVYYRSKRMAELPRLLCRSCADGFAQYLERRNNNAVASDQT